MLILLDRQFLACQKSYSEMYRVCLWCQGPGLNRRQSSLVVENDLEDFKLFAYSKLNLSKETVKHYVRRVRAFLENRSVVTDRDVQIYIQEKKDNCKSDYVSNIISSFKAYFRDYKGLSFMDGYKHPSSTLRIKEEIEPEKVKRFIGTIDNIAVKCAALLMATSGLRKGEVLGLRKSDIDRNLVHYS